ncbi:MAG TPA: DUF192 domain-containing protein [Opitutus sp.]|nr:DUF192 domain-containing protein [Opitutus sp.]
MKNANPVCLRGWLPLRAFVAIVLLPLAGCDRQKSEAAVTDRKSVADYFEIRVGDKPVRVQVAVLDDEMQRGLMERRDLAPNDGMLFVYDRPQSMSFWMRNTPTPLDIGFFDQRGKLLEIYALHPFDETGVKSRSAELLFALETNQGWFRENGIKPGAQFDMKALAAALEARGFKPDRFGIRPDAAVR